MAPPAPAWTRSLPVLIGLALVLGFLYAAKVVVIPLALAILITFLLAPPVMWMQRRGVPRVPAVMLATLLALAAVIGSGYAVTRQIGDLLDSYPRYEQNITAKITGLRTHGRAGLIEKMQSIAQRISIQLDQAQVRRPAVARTEAERAQPVKIVDEGPFRLSQLWSVAGPLLEPLADTGLVLVLVIFMLINREDLRDRVIALIGPAQVADTTRALDDAGGRVSRYLLRQLLINVGYGIAVMLGLWAIGVPYAPLWGFFAALLRYIPYLGPWLAAMLPIMLSLLIAREWTTALMVIGLFGVLELITNMLIEPMIYGRGMGVSQAALLVAVAFWTWFWGPVGLVLASPLTVCLVVLGRHVPFLKFFDTMLGDRPALEPPVRYYQRLLARDQDEATELAESLVRDSDVATIFDDVLVPALAMGRADLRAGKIDAESLQQVCEGTRLIAEEVGEDAATSSATAVTETSTPFDPSATRLRVLACPARDAVDEVALGMLQQLSANERIDWIPGRAAHLVSDIVALVESERPDVLCIGSVPPGGLSHAKHLCLRVRARFPNVAILVGRWGLYAEDLGKTRTALEGAGATALSTRLSEARLQLQELAQRLPAHQVAATAS
jgi:predicted PurR-regulated permease PerM